MPPVNMGARELVPFVCEGCGFGQLGDDGVRSKEEARGWDGKTTLSVPKGDDPGKYHDCPATRKPEPTGDDLRAEVARLTAVVAELTAAKKKPAAKKKAG